MGSSCHFCSYWHSSSGSSGLRSRKTERPDRTNRSKTNSGFSATQLLRQYQHLWPLSVFGVATKKQEPHPIKTKPAIPGSLLRRSPEMAGVTYWIKITVLAWEIIPSGDNRSSGIGRCGEKIPCNAVVVTLPRFPCFRIPPPPRSPLAFPPITSLRAALPKIPVAFGSFNLYP